MPDFAINAAIRGSAGMKVFVAGLMLAVAATPAAAQLGGGSSGHSTSSPLNNLKPFKELIKSGQCFAKTERRTALMLIATKPGSKEEDAAFSRSWFGDDVPCLFGGTEMRMPIVFARGAVAEGLLTTGGIPAELRLSAPGPTETKDLHDVARCYVGSHRSEAQNVLAQPPGSPQEVKAVGAIWEGFRTCMPGFNVRLNAPWIRFLLAEALLRLPPDAATRS